MARVESALVVAEWWERWCGETEWSKWMRRWHDLGGRVIWWGGYPQSKSAIPLVFQLVDSSGKRLDGNSRLMDIRHAVMDGEGEKRRRARWEFARSRR